MIAPPSSSHISFKAVFARRSRTSRVTLATLFFASGVSAASLAGCGGEHVRLGGAGETGSGGLGSDASSFASDSGRAGGGAGGTGGGAGGTGSSSGGVGAADAEIPPSDARGFDTEEYYCSLPEPSPCCCESVVIEVQPTSLDGGSSSAACDISVTDSRGRIQGGGYAAYGVQVEFADGGTTYLPYVRQCEADGSGWTFTNERQEAIRICPESCNALANGTNGYVVMRIGRACPAIACPPP